MSERDIKPCPFCGSEGVKVIDITKTLSKKDPGYIVGCWSCYSEGPLKETEQEAITAWNELELQAQLTQAQEDYSVAHAAVEFFKGEVKELRERLTQAQANAAGKTELLKMAYRAIVNPVSVDKRRLLKAIERALAANPGQDILD